MEILARMQRSIHTKNFTALLTSRAKNEKKKNQISIVRVQLWYTHILKYNAAIKSRELAGTIQRGLAWPLYKNDMQICEVFHKKKECD